MDPIVGDEVESLESRVVLCTIRNTPWTAITENITVIDLVENS